MKLTIGFSPCPNDTFIFDALINNKIDTEGIEFVAVLEDVETLNQQAIESTYDVSKISYGVYNSIAENYIILNSGSALGTGVGPLLIAKELDSSLKVENQIIALPGKNTTANFLFSIEYPMAHNKKYLRYDEIEKFVLDGHGLGVIIHENRFTYQEKGLKKIIDLGEVWEEKNAVPIPLGGIVMHRKFEKELHKKVEQLIQKSIAYSYSTYPTLAEFVKENSQEMSEDVMRKHIDLYVNEYSLSLGEQGKFAVNKMLNFLSADNQHKTKPSFFTE